MNWLSRWWWRNKRPCHICKGKGGWDVPAHRNHWEWPVVPAYWKQCWRCNGKGWLPYPDAHRGSS